jgi:hypothetical protein
MEKPSRASAPNWITSAFSTSCARTFILALPVRIDMTLELQSSKKKSKKDRKPSDDRKRKDRATDVSSQGDLAIDGEEVRERKRKKSEKEGAIDGAFSHLFALQCVDPDTVIRTRNYRYKKAQG